MPIPLDPRKKPASVKIHVTNGTGVDIVWSDDHVSHYDFAYLRDECPCATCNEEREKKRAFASSAITPFKLRLATVTPPESIVTIFSAPFARVRIAPRPFARSTSSRTNSIEWIASV